MSASASHLHPIPKPPTLFDMNIMEDSYAFLARFPENDAGTGLAVYVRASSVDNVHVKFTCPCCWTSYKKDGSPRANAKRKTHMHGSCGDTRVRFVHVTPHCDVGRFPKGFNGFYIAITSSTAGSHCVDDSDANRRVIAS